jgi:hypothetical protein
LGNEIHVQGPRHHLALGLRIKPDVARDYTADELGVNQLSDPDPRRSSVVGDHDKFALFLPHKFVDDRARRTDAHETANHQACARRDHGDGILKTDGSHSECPLHHPAAIDGKRCAEAVILREAWHGTLISGRLI